MTSTLLAALLTTSLSAPPPVEPQGPVTPAVRTVNGLGLSLYAQLAAAQPGENLFFSPFSVGAALTMVAEGARDETLDELRAALHVPSDVPLQTVHAAFAALQRRYREGGGDASPQTTARIAELRSELAAANRAAEELSRTRNWKESREAASKAQAIADQLNVLLTQVGRYELQVAGGLWVERTFPLVPAFAAALDRHYGTGAAQPLDFRGDPTGARSHINAWVASHTGDRIRDLLPAGAVTDLASLVVANAVWFRGEWQEPFEARQTRDEDFLLANGERRQVPLMRDRWRGATPYAAFTADGQWFDTPREVPAEPGAAQPQTYPGEDGFLMVELPYKGGELAMVVIAPRAVDGLPRLEALLTEQRLAAWLERLRPRTVDTALPRWAMRGTYELADALRAAGVHRAFVVPDGRGGAQFGGISAAADPQQQVAITGVHHQAWLEVTEKGTEAAAATAVAMAPGAAARVERMVPFTPVFRADRPFVFLIRDVKSGAVLFLGRVLDPGA